MFRVNWKLYTILHPEGGHVWKPWMVGHVGRNGCGKTGPFGFEPTCKETAGDATSVLITTTRFCLKPVCILIFDSDCPKLLFYCSSCHFTFGHVLSYKTKNSAKKGMVVCTYYMSHLSHVACLSSILGLASAKELIPHDIK